MVAAYTNSTSKYMVYRNFVKALPWLTVVREKVTDPAHSTWFLNFSHAVQGDHSLSHLPVCDTSYSPLLCTHMYHDQILTPKHEACGGKCGVGSVVPVREYLFDFRAANVSVNGQTMVDWFITEYMLGKSGAGNPNVVGYLLWEYNRSSKSFTLTLLFGLCMTYVFPG